MTTNENNKNIQEFLEKTQQAGFEPRKKPSRTEKILSILNDLTTLPFLTWIVAYVIPKAILGYIDPAMKVSYEHTINQFNPILLSFIVSIALTIIERTKKPVEPAIRISLNQRNQGKKEDTEK